jgi:hypothetical protein
MVPAHAELNRVAKRRTANDFDGRSLAKPHFQQAATEIRVAADVDDAPATADTQLVEGTGRHWPAVIASC